LANPSPPSQDAATVVLTFLTSVGRRSDAELYLKLFRELPKESFALILVEASVLRYSAGSLVEQLGFLHELGLVAPVVVGVFEPIRAEGAVVRLAKRAASIGAVVLDAKAPDLTEAVRREVAAEHVPVIGFWDTLDLTPAQRFEHVGRLAGTLGTRKIVVLRRRGGLSRHWRPLGGVASERALSIINLRTDIAELREPRAMPQEDSELLEYLTGILGRPDLGAAVASVTSPLSMLRELFTVKGAGTLVKLGTSIEKHTSYATVDIPRLRALLESSFGRPLAPEFFEQDPLAVYLEENYRGAAIVEPAPIAPYLTKFAVDRVAQGEGMGRDLFDAMLRDHPSLYWRGRTENPISNWYVGLCDGMMKTGIWSVYFKGVRPADVPTLVEDAASRAEDFTPTASATPPSPSGNPP
jgi:acetylglutamate kinase